MRPFVFSMRPASLVILRRSARTALGTVCLGLAAMASTQAAPSVQWFGVSGEVFAVDEKTNVYVNANGPILKLDANGTVIRSNTICPLYGFAQRDSAGNFYFANTFQPPQDFGGTTVSNGYMYVAKYSDSGTLQWARSFGPDYVNSINLGSLSAEPGGTVYAGYDYCLGSSCSYAKNVVDALDNTGSNIWTQVYHVPSYTDHRVRLGVPTVSNVCALVFIAGPPQSWGLWGFSLNRAGVSPLSLPGAAQPVNQDTPTAARPIQNRLGELYVLQGPVPPQTSLNTLSKYSNIGGLIWSVGLGDQASYTVGEDPYDGVLVASSNGRLRRFDSGGGLSWTLNLSSPVKAVVMDAKGNRFLSLRSGAVGRLGPETLAAPQIVVSPANTTAFAGSNVSLSVTATGSGPLQLLLVSGWDFGSWRDELRFTSVQCYSCPIRQLFGDRVEFHQFNHQRSGPGAHQGSADFQRRSIAYEWYLYLPRPTDAASPFGLHQRINFLHPGRLAS